MAKHVVSVVFLSLPAFLTVILLAFCLISDYWININEDKLTKTKIHLSRDYTNKNHSHLLGTDNDLRPPTSPQGPQTDDLDLNPNIISYKNEIKITTTTMPTTTTEEESSSSTTNYYDNSYLYDYDDLYDDNDDGLSKDTTLQYKRERRQIKNVRLPPYLFMTALWPLIKFKSLYSECVQYVRLEVKISRNYLIQSNKAPIVGTIHYDDATIQQQQQQQDVNCPRGQIRCLLTPKKCVIGKVCDGIVDCNDQSDEQQCSNNHCNTDSPGYIQCDNRCWQFWHKCDQRPHCLDGSDERDCKPAKQIGGHLLDTSGLQMNKSDIYYINNRFNEEPFKLGNDFYNSKYNCFTRFFDFKSATQIDKENLKYLTQHQADNLQQYNNLNYHFQVIYSLSFGAALVFSILALLSLIFLMCFGKLCYQCPFWFYGFFVILTWLACCCGLMTFLYQFYSNRQRAFDPSTRLPLDNELLRLNPQIANLQTFGISFWFAIAATGTSFVGSFISCIVCCRLPPTRHEDKEYKIMQLPSYA